MRVAGMKGVTLVKLFVRPRLDLTAMMRHSPTQSDTNQCDRSIQN